MHKKKKAIIFEENDPDILQIKDELNTAWVTSWEKKTLDYSEKTDMTFYVQNKNAQKLPAKK